MLKQNSKSLYLYSSHSDFGSGETDSSFIIPAALKIIFWNVHTIMGDRLIRLTWVRFGWAEDETVAKKTAVSGTILTFELGLFC